MALNGNTHDVFQKVHDSARAIRRWQEREDRRMAKKAHTKYKPFSQLNGAAVDPMKAFMGEQPKEQNTPESRLKLDIVHEFVVARAGGRGGPPVSGVYAHNSPDRHKKRVRVAVGADVLELMEWTPGTRLTLAILRDGRFALIESANGWKLDFTKASKSASVRIPNIKTSSERVTADLLGDHFIFPAGSFISIQ